MLRSWKSLLFAIALACDRGLARVGVDALGCDDGDGVRGVAGRVTRAAFGMPAAAGADRDDGFRRECAQLQNAVNNAAAGTTVLVQDGTYNLNGGIPAYRRAERHAAVGERQSAQASSSMADT